MKKILLADYYGTCDSYGNELGHSSKVLKEYSDLIQDDYEISVALAPCLVRKITDGQSKDFCKIYDLKYDICMENLNSIRKRIKDKFKLLYNLHQVFKIHDYDILWFYRTDFFLALYLNFFIPRKRKKRCPKIVVLIYQNSFGEYFFGRILNCIYNAGFKKVDAIIRTQKVSDKLRKPTLYIPDYYYDDRKYAKYQGMKKEDKVVCVGTMSPYKQVVLLADAFNRNGFRLEIRGYFYDKEQYCQLLENKRDNILVEDVILTEDEYYSAIASAKYAVLPYDMGQYQCRTSGVLQECVFLNTIAIAPEQLLQENQIEGIGYSNMEELADATFFETLQEIDYGSKRKEFDKKEIGKKLKKFLSDI